MFISSKPDPFPWAFIHAKPSPDWGLEAEYSEEDSEA